MFDYKASVDLLRAIRLNRFSPKAIVMTVGPSAQFDNFPAPCLTRTGVPAFREEAGWLQENIFGPVTWDPVLNFTDPDFGDSQRFYELYKAASAWLSLTIFRYFANALESRAIRAPLT